MAKTIIVSNRLPVKIQRDAKGNTVSKPSEGGLATGLVSVYKKGNNVWVGWPALFPKDKKEEQEITASLKEGNMSPIYLTEEDIKGFYEGFSNETLWPTFHYFNQYAEYRRSLWESYQEVNAKFAEAVLQLAEPEDTIWVHDYQMMLLPGMLREKMPQAGIGFFLHIPFPSYEVFRLLPWRRDLLDGVLGADLIGFHTYDDMRHFLSSVSRICYISNQQGQLFIDNRMVQVDSFPMGIDYEKYASAASAPETIKREVKFRTSMGEEKLMLSIDRLDYSKGIPARLEIFDLFLRRYPEYRGKVSLLMIVVPSRDQVAKYKHLKEEVDLLVGRINGQYGSLNWTPIHYFYRSFPLEDLSAFYRMADVALVTPMRDGMNLVCKEFVASKLDKRGVLILSEMCGASKELSDAIIINPNDKTQVVEAIHTALNMPEEEQVRHLETMQATIKRYNIHHWVELFFSRLDDVIAKQRAMGTHTMDTKLREAVAQRYKEAKYRLIFLDYDGTLVPFSGKPQDAKPDKELLDLLKRLTADNKVVIISGRDRESLEQWVGNLPVDIIGEHGVWLKENGNGKWHTIDKLDNRWKKEIGPILETYVNKTPGSLVEQKDYSMVWHYRRVEPGLGELRAREIISHLKYLSSNMGLQVLEGDKVVEIKNLEVNKGRAAQRWLEQNPADFIMAVGDDWTDEDTFKAMPEDAITIKVGGDFSAAKYSVPSYKEVRDILKGLK